MKIIAITMGDPAGIGPEIILKTFHDQASKGRSLLVVGDASILREVQSKIFDTQLEVRSIESLDEASFDGDIINVWDLKLLETGSIIPGEVSPIAGNAAFQYIIEAIILAQRNIVDSIV